VLVEISPEGDASHIAAVEQSVLETVEDYGGQAGAIVGYQCGVAARKVVPITEDSAWAISVVVLVSVMLFALKSQFASVAERTKEIGILKALGWTDIDVMKQVLLESLLLGVAGGIIGVGVGYLFAFLIPQLGLVPTENLVLAVSPLLVLLGVLLAVSGGALAGVIPAWRAAKLQPAEALRRF
jgi:putative ABC transport system permease protein